MDRRRQDCFGPDAGTTNGRGRPQRRIMSCNGIWLFRRTSWTSGRGIIAPRLMIRARSSRKRFVFVSREKTGARSGRHPRGHQFRIMLLERFRAKWVPVRVKKTRQNKRLEPPFRFNRNGKGSGAQLERNGDRADFSPG